jgi:hypothetical protein
MKKLKKHFDTNVYDKFRHWSQKEIKKTAGQRKEKKIIIISFSNKKYFKENITEEFMMNVIQEKFVNYGILKILKILYNWSKK